MRRKLRQWWTDSQAQDLVEYALASGAITMAAVAVLPVLNGTYSALCSKIGSLIRSSVG